MKEKKKQEFNLDIYRKVLQKLIKDKKITFKFYNNSSLSLDLLQICYNEKEDIIELEFRDIMEEHLQELREIMNKNNV